VGIYKCIIEATHMALEDVGTTAVVGGGRSGREGLPIDGEWGMVMAILKRELGAGGSRRSVEKV
jgi:hypothetical protein